MLKGYFDGIPREIEEAALVDGLTRLGALRRVIRPLAAPGIVTVAVNAFLLSWNEFFFAYVFLATNDNFTLSLGSTASSSSSPLSGATSWPLACLARSPS